mmetsp:Transcript_28752/g.31930  ORF Transcript_28752/g.31930 Transcript_28752/m.31930 type:complete len:223 (+) Transcript_28752:44-712(+)
MASAHVLTFLALVAILCFTTHGYEVEGRIKLVMQQNGTYQRMEVSRTQRRNILTNLKIFLYGDDRTYSTSALADGTWELTDVPPGAYLLEVASADLDFPKYRVDVSKKHNGKVRSKVAFNDAKQRALPYPMVIFPVQGREYFTPRKSFNIVGMILKNPMMMMLGLMGVMMVLMQYVDPQEAMKELQKEQQEQNENEDDPIDESLREKESDELLAMFYPKKRR